jgi:hypothetical protein
LQKVRCDGASGCHALSFLRGISSDIRTATAFCDCSFAYSSSRHGISRGTLALVTRPGRVEEQQPCFLVRDHGGEALTRVYFGREAGRRSAAKLFTKDETRRIAANIAKFPELLRNGRGGTGETRYTSNF